MTRTQLQSMSVRDLIEHARRTHLNLMKPDGDLILELVKRLDDCYVFTWDEQAPNIFTDFEKEPEL
jgi:hypothetical protein